MATSATASAAGKSAAATTSSPWLGDEPGALNVDKVLQQVSQDDQDEWEYEYSATETEVRSSYLHLCGWSGKSFAPSKANFCPN